MNNFIKITETGYWEGTHPHHAFSKPLLDWMIDFLKDYKNKPIYDFGCGIGQYLKRMSDAGFINLTGFEGSIPKVEFPNVKQQDLTAPFSVDIPGIVISLEVAEHIPPKYTDIYLNNIKNACEIGMPFISSWAVKGQGGDGHVNELDNEEAINLVSSYGFEFLQKESVEARNKNKNENGLPWFSNTVMIFRRK